VPLEASESGRIEQGWVYTATGWGGARQPTLRGPLSGAEAAARRAAARQREARQRAELVHTVAEAKDRR
jgi:hypothetical protein